MRVQTMEKTGETMSPSAGKCHNCGNSMVKTLVTLKRDYKETTLSLVGFPAHKCLNCDFENYGTGSLIRHIEAARARFDLTGDNFYYCK